jgi:hypothetical protein
MNFLNPGRVRVHQKGKDNPSLPMETLLQDIRFGFRQLVKKGFAALAII